MAVKRVKDIEQVEVVEKTEMPTTGMLAELTKEIIENPAGSLKLIQALRKITKPWEMLGNTSGLGNVNEVSVPPNVSAKEFVNAQKQQGPFVSGYRLQTIFGEDVALIIKDTPKYKIFIEGELMIDAPFVQHGQKAEQNAKEFAEKKAEERGYVIGR